MKKLIKIAGIITIFAMIFTTSSCSSDDDGESSSYSEPYYPLEKISIANFDAEISINNEYNIAPEFTPTNATNKAFTITVTSNDGKAIDWVTVNGTTIKATDEGTFKLTVTSKSNAKLKDTKTITAKPIEITGISITTTETLYVGRTISLSPTFTPENASYKNVSWTSSDETIATVDKFGVVTGIKTGKTTITVQSEKNSNIKAELEIEVKPVLPTKMTLKANSLSAQAGGACTIATVFEPLDTTDKSVTYESSDPTNFTVSDSGIVSVGASASGTATITVKSVANTNLSATATVKVISGTNYIIDDNDTSLGFVSTTGSTKTGDNTRTGYLGSNYLENFSKGEGDNIVYSIASATSQDVQLLLHYAFWGGNGSKIRAAYVVVNGAQDEEIIKLPYTAKRQTVTNGVVTDSDNVKEFDADGVTPKTFHAIWEESNSITVHLDAGENQIRIIPVPNTVTLENPTYQIISQKDTGGNYITPKNQGANSDGKAEGYLPNIDYLQITGSGIGAGSNSLAFYSVKTSGDFGTVALEPNQSFYKEGASVKLVPSPNTDYKFDSYSGRTNKGSLIGSAVADYTFNIYDDYTIEGHFIPTSYNADSEMTGYATLTADNVNAKYTITGGAGGEIITIASLSDLTSNSTKLSGNIPYIVKFTTGTRICTSDNKSIIINIGSNKTIYGATSGAGLKNIEMRVGGQNVIIRNLVLGEVIAYDTLPDYAGTGNDALSLNGARHVWVDHCEIRSNTTPLDINGNAVSNPGDSDFAKDFYDGLLDIKNGATWITVSNCYFHDHYKAVLCGSGDDGPDTNKEGYSDSDMRVTFANNHWKNVNARQPLFRYGKAHIYGSYFDAGTFSGSASFINCRAGSELYIEGNTFLGTKTDNYTIGFYYADSSKKYGNTSGTWVSVNNSGVSTNNGTSYVPAYGVTNVTAPSSAPTSAGATLTSLSY